MPKKTRITKQFIDHRPPTEVVRTFWCDRTRTLGLRQNPNGTFAWFAQYRMQDGRQQKPNLGYYPEVLPEEARRRATALMAEIAAGKDPMAERKAAKKVGTFSDLASRYMIEHARVKKKESSADEDQRLLDTVILPALARKKLSDVRRADIQKLHWDLRKTPYQANRVLALLSKMFKLAERWDLRPEHSNPCHHVERYKEQGREQFLSDEGYRRLIKVLDEAETERTVSSSAILAIRLLMLTGRRKGEILKLRWSDVDLAAGTMTLPDTKTGRKRFALSPEVVDLLVRSKSSAYQSEWVIPGRRRGKPMDNIQKPWERIRKACRA